MWTGATETMRQALLVESRVPRRCEAGVGQGKGMSFPMGGICRPTHTVLWEGRTVINAVYSHTQRTRERLTG